MRARLGDIATYINGYAFKPSDWSDEGRPIIRIQDLTGNSYQANRFSGEVDKKYNVSDGDVLISWSASLGVYVWKGEDAVLNQHIFKVVFDKAEVNKSFFIHQVENILENAGNEAHGATMKHLTKPVFDALPFYLPSMKEQNEIAERLDMVSRLIALKKDQLDSLDLLVKSKFVEMFGNPASNPMCWNECLLGERCEIITGNTPSRADEDNYGNYIEWIKSDNINTPNTYLTVAEEYLSEKGAKQGRIVGAGSVLMTCIAGSIGCIGNVAIADREVAFNQQINAIIPTQDEPLYIYWLMQLSKPYIQSTINMSLKGILSKGKLSQLDFPFPPVKLQKEFSDFVRINEKTKSAVQKSINELETLKKSLMQKYFG